MRFYFEVFKFYLREEFAYPAEVLGFLARKIINLGFLIFFWFVISGTNPEIFTFKQIVSYFLISESVGDLTFTSGRKFGRNIQKMIKDGRLSNYIIKPIKLLEFLYISYIGSRTSSTFYALIMLTLGIILYPPQSAWVIMLFPLSLALTALVGFGVNVYIATIGFYSPEAGSVQNVYEHINRVFSGSLIPISYFPPVLKLVTEFSFFPILAYYPTIILQSGGFNKETFLKLGLSALWGLVLVKSSKYFWNKALKNYDGVGI